MHVQLEDVNVWAAVNRIFDLQESGVPGSQV